MSDEPELGLESEHFVTIDDRILLAGEGLQAQLKEASENFTECMDDVGKEAFKYVAEILLRACNDERADNPETLEVARRSFLFAKLIGYYVLHPNYIQVSSQKVSGDDEDEGLENPMQLVVNASWAEWRDSSGLKGLINAHRGNLDPNGSQSDIVELFAGFALLNMNNALYFAGDSIEQMQVASETMSQASEEDWQHSLDELLAE
jgi:hypothetical protein